MANDRGGRTGGDAVRAALAMGERGEEHRFRRRLVVIASVAGLFLAAGIAVPFALRKRPPPPDPTPEQLLGGQLLAPLPAPAPGSADPETVSPFSGFAVSVETDPPGAVVTVAGKVLGEAPVLAGIECEQERPVEIRAEKRGYAPGQWTTRCRADSVVKVKIPLRRR